MYRDTHHWKPNRNNSAISVLSENGRDVPIAGDQPSKLKPTATFCIGFIRRQLFLGLGVRDGGYRVGPRLLRGRDGDEAVRGLLLSHLLLGLDLHRDVAVRHGFLECDAFARLKIHVAAYNGKIAN